MYEELVKGLHQRIALSPAGSPLQEELLQAADAIEELVGKTEQLPRWIPVTERLPEERKAVIVREPRYLNPYICVLSEGEWYVFGGYGVKVFGVTHWMPLPEPTKEEAGTEESKRRKNNG